MSQPAEIVAEELTKAYGKFLAVDNISFAVPKGMVVGFLGPNGAGKTTTIRMLTCFMPPTSGSARVAGFDVFHDSLKVRSHLGYLPENAPVYMEMRVAEYLQFRGRLRGMDRSRLKERIAEVTELCWLADRRRWPISKLSKGYRQRLGIADALLHNPPVLILDEPTVGLDPAQIRETRKLIANLAGMHTVLLSTHILSEVELVCQKVIIIGRGKILAQGSPEELKQQCAQRGAGAKLVLEIRGPADQIRSALAALPGVDQVRIISDTTVATLELTGKLDGALREQMAALIQQRGWALREMRSSGASLEEFFVQITDPGAAAAA
ncbi:MAG: ABC transporter ATP-binding protein [Planctomycetes bacterium]|jgi:ABC-2 type transport system ATP-binding protein|nr:ABC transporter ATP-binding protein [Planctomycetota bacterium]MDA8377538.1 ATP-binding cassette domain-containing protein [Planctomycetia bacterium]